MFEYMKPDACLLNFARGELVDSNDLKVMVFYGNGDGVL
jgi:phosphoglycerate dehydrogenase-like enzyme